MKRKKLSLDKPTFQMKQISVLVMILFISYCGYGQTKHVLILQKTINTFHSFKTLSYDYRSVNKNPFSAGDTVRTNIKSILVFDGKGFLKRTRDRMEINKSRFESFFRNDTLYQVDLADSTYTFYPKIEQANISMGITPLIEMIKYAIEKTPSKIFQRKDTVVNGIDCYNFFIKTYDSVADGQRNFTYDHIAIDKATKLPVCYKSKGEGIAEKDGHVIGRLTFFNEDYFSNFKIDKVIAPSAFFVDLSPFSLANKQMLAEGSTAPILKLKTYQNTEVPPAEFKNKLLLITFGSTVCGANPLANPMLNRLYKKFESSNFSVVSIYASEPADEVKKYVDANDLKFPVYIGNKQTRKAFKTVGTPNFYLVDKNGHVIKSVNGYSDDLEEQLTAQIDEVLKK